MTHLKAIILFFLDPHLYAGMVGVFIAFSPELLEILSAATICVKLLVACGGGIIMLLTIYHKWIQIQNEKKR